MEKMWNVTITKIGSIYVEADTEDEAMEKAEKLALKQENIKWEDSWNAVDVCEVEKFDL